MQNIMFMQSWAGYSSCEILALLGCESFEDPLTLVGKDTLPYRACLRYGTSKIRCSKFYRLYLLIEVFQKAFEIVLQS